MSQQTTGTRADQEANAAQDEGRVLATACWTLAFLLLGFLALAHLGVLISFAAGWRVSAIVAPAALLAAFGAGDWLARREGVRGWLRLAIPLAALAVLCAAVLLSAAFFDLSWDGLWYHQTAVYQMAHGWNPLRNPMRAFEPTVVDSLRHYAKGPWYVALSLFATTSHIEWAKAATWIALAAMFLAVAAALVEFGTRRRDAVAIAALVSLNPVVIFELASFLVDGLLISFLACYVAAVAACIRRPRPLVQAVLAASAVLSINTKFSGLVYLCFFCAAGGGYLIIRHRRTLMRYAAQQAACILLGVAVFGFNPYVTNTIHRGHPFYPWMGTAAHPGYAERGQDPVERWETPHNMLGRGRLVRFSYALFGRPGAQPFFPGENARLMWPFDVGWKDFAIFYFHDVRISGFGPLFSGAFLIALVLLGAALVRPGWPREVVLLAAAAIVASLLSGMHMWWARYGPQLWWLPVIAVATGLAVPGWRAVRWAAWGLAALLLVNAALVEAVHFRWEIQATRTTHEQLARLRNQGEVQVDFQYFREPFSERLRAAGVTFRGTRRLSCDKPMELMSITPGYPGVVRACVSQN